MQGFLCSCAPCRPLGLLAGAVPDIREGLEVEPAPAGAAGRAITRLGGSSGTATNSRVARMMVVEWQEHALWAWRALMLATLTWSLLAFSYIAVAVVAIWMATEMWLRRQRNRLAP